MVSEQPIPLPAMQETKTTTRPPTTKTKTHTSHKRHTIQPPGNLEHRYQKILGEKMSVLTIDGQEYLIGVEIASLLQRETYNLYRSMKGVKKITVRKASPEQVDYLLKTNVVKLGTRSITFIPLDQGTSYIKEEFKKGLRKKSKDKSSACERKTLNEPRTPQPMVIAELDVEVEARLEQKQSQENDNSAFEVLCAAAEYEYDTQATTLKKSSSSLSNRPISTSTPFVIPLPFPPESSSTPATSTTTTTTTTTSSSEKHKLDNFFPFLLPSLFGVGAHDNAIYKPYGENLPKVVENQRVTTVLGR